jgi:hypothetical protein
MGEVKLSPTATCWTSKKTSCRCEFAEFRIRNPSESDQTAWKLIVLRGRRMFCNEEDLGELLSVDLDVTGEPDEDGFVTASSRRSCA